VLTALRTLEELAKRPAGVSELGRALGLPKSTTHRSLTTLAQAGWVRQSKVDGTKWVLTGRPLTVGLAGSVEGNLRELARAEMQQLRAAVGETVHLVVPDPPDLVVVARADGTNALRTFLQLGSHAPLHATASGRAILAAMSDDAVADVLDAGVQKYTDSTLFTRDAVLDEIERTRERGYAVNAAEWRTDIAAVGAAILTRAGAPVAGLAISMPLSRYEESDLREVGELAKESARNITEQVADWQQSDTWLG